MVTEPYVHLTGSEYKLLEALQKAQGGVVEWADLSEIVLGYYNRDAAKVHLCRLRQKIPDLKIDVVRGVGVRLAITPPCAHCRGTGFALFEGGDDDAA
jgi:DNA-binding response OmpR family regulator